MRELTMDTTSSKYPDAVPEFSGAAISPRLSHARLSAQAFNKGLICRAENTRECVNAVLGEAPVVVK